MLARHIALLPAVILAFLMMLHLPATWSPALAEVALSGDGIVRVKSAHGFDETIELLKKDIAAKGIMFFMAVDQAKLGENAGIMLPPSTLLIFGNPPLGIQFLTSNPECGARLAGAPARDAGRQGSGVGGLHGFRLDQAPPRHREPRRCLQDGFERHRLDHLERRGKVGEPRSAARARVSCIREKPCA